MKKILALSLVMILFGGTAAAEKACKASDKKCLARIAEGGLAAEKIMRGAIEEVMLLLEDPIIKKVIAAQLADCETPSEKLKDDAKDIENSDEEIAENPPAEAPGDQKIECYREILSNHFIIDMLPEAFSESVQKFFMSGGKT